MLRLPGILLTLLLLTGCAGSYYRVEPEVFAGQVKTLGVLPVLVDEGSTVLHPDRDAVLRLLWRTAAGREERLVERLARDRGVDGVRALVVADGPALAKRLLANAALEVRGEVTYRGYRPDAALIGELAREHGVDAVLLVVLNGLDNRQKRWDRTGWRYLVTNFNFIQATALIVAADGTLLWERPGAGDEAFLDLQYPGFDEAYHSRSNLIKVHYLTTEALERVLLAPERSFLRESRFPAVYQKLFDALGDALRVKGGWWKKSSPNGTGER